MQKTNFKPPQNKNDLTGLLSNLIQGKKISIFIDSANLYFAGNVAKLRIDYKQIYRWFSEKSELVGLNYYTAFDPEDKKQEDFLKELESTGYRIIKKPIKVYQDFTKGNMDIELAVDALMMKELYDVLILISGDGDFTYLIQALENQGKTIIVLGIGGFTSYELHQVADNYFFLNRISKVWQTPRKSKDVKKDNNRYIPGIGVGKKAMVKSDTQLNLETKPYPVNKKQNVQSKVKQQNKILDTIDNNVNVKNNNNADSKSKQIKHPPVRIKLQTKAIHKHLNKPDEPKIFLI